MKITLYSKSGCPLCDQAKNLLKSKGMAYDEYWVDANIVAEKRMREAGIRQMPAIYINDQYVGGFAGLQAALKQVGL
jgi:glutaredoxin 3